MDLYSTFIVVSHTQGAQVWITQCYLQMTPYLPLPRKHSPDCASPDWGYYSLILIYLPRQDERLSQPGWLTYSGRFTHISGHPSAAGRAQDSESSPVRDRRSTTVPRNQPMLVMWHDLVFCSGHGGVCTAVSDGVSNKEGSLFSTWPVLARKSFGTGSSLTFIASESQDG